MITRYDGTTKVADVTFNEDNIPEPEAPIKRTTTWTGPWGTAFQVARYGDIVTMSCNNTTSGAIPASGSGTETLPYGYRPYTTVASVARYGSNHGFATLSTSGQMSWGFSQVDPSAQRFTVDFAYITNDGEPS